MAMQGLTARFLMLGAAALLAVAAQDLAEAATPQPNSFTTRIEPPSESMSLAGAAGDNFVAFTTRIGDVASTFSIDRAGAAGHELLPRMLGSRSIGTTLAGAKIAADGWSWGVSAGFGGTDFTSSVASTSSGFGFLPPGAPTRRNGWTTGLEYDFGVLQLGGYYQFTHADVGFTPPGRTENAYGLGANYTLAPGMRLFSEAFFYNDATGHSGAAASGGTSLKPQTGQLYVVGTHLEW